MPEMKKLILENEEFEIVDESARLKLDEVYTKDEMQFKIVEVISGDFSISANAQNFCTFYTDELYDGYVPVGLTRLLFQNQTYISLTNFNLSIVDAKVRIYIGAHNLSDYAKTTKVLATIVLAKAAIFDQ